MKNGTDINSGLELRDALAAGDHEAISLVYREYGESLFTVCMRYADSRETAEDLFQEGFLHCLKKIGKFNAQSSLKTWMYRVISNFCIDFNCRRKIHFSDLDENLEVETGEYEEDPECDQELLLKTIQELPLGYRTVLNMFVMEDLSHAEIASKLNISVATSRSQLYKARKMLIQMLEGVKDGK